jgi:hypothetical protein
VRVSAGTSRQAGHAVSARSQLEDGTRVSAGTSRQAGHAVSARSQLEDGTRVSAETSRRIACDCALVRVARAPAGGAVLDAGRRTRTIAPAVRRAPVVAHADP